MARQQGGNMLQALRKERDATLEELEKYKLLVDSIQDYAIFLMDENGYIKTWNKGAERYKGYKPHEIIGKHFSVFYMPSDIESGKPERELEIATQFGRAEDEDWRVRKDGSKFWASVVITALHDRTGNLVGFAKVTRDLTERKIHEDELRRANALLKVHQARLEALNQSKDEFVSLASHQLRTPATAIKQLLGLFVEGFYSGLDEKHLNIIKKAYLSNERQLDIVNGLLKVAQIDSGKVALHMGEVNVGRMLEEIADEFEDTVGSRRQTLVLETAQPDIVAVADAENLRMAIENLVSNASKYTHRGGHIQLSAISSDGMVHISITDNGVGIARKNLAGLFEKFSRIPNELSDEVGGTGLGLYWADQVIRLHGGHIEVESRLHKGTTFHVFLPERQDA